MLDPLPAMVTVQGERGLDPFDQILGLIHRPANIVLRRDPVGRRVNGNRRDLGLGAVSSSNCRGPTGHRLGYRVAETLAAADYYCRITGRVAHGEFLVREFPVLVKDAVTHTILDRQRPDIPVTLPRQWDESVGEIG